MTQGRPRERDGLWRALVFEAAADMSRPSAGAISRSLAGMLSGVEAPSPRTVGRILESYRELDPSEQGLYATFRWPETMEAAVLPWEAGAAALELLRYLRQACDSRPRTNLVRWFWRVSVATPSAPIEMRLAAAKQLCAVERLKGRHDDRDKRSIEWYFALRAWEDPLTYESAIKAAPEELEAIPHWSGAAELTTPPGTVAADLADALIALMGGSSSAYREPLAKYLKTRFGYLDTGEKGNEEQ